MVVRFDNKAVQQTVESKAEPIGVEGDPTSVKGGISEADAIVKEARKSMGNGGKLDAPEKDVIREEEEKEPGPVRILRPLVSPSICSSDCKTCLESRLPENDVFTARRVPERGGADLEIIYRKWILKASRNCIRPSKSNSMDLCISCTHLSLRSITICGKLPRAQSGVWLRFRNEWV